MASFLQGFWNISKSFGVFFAGGTKTGIFRVGWAWTSCTRFKHTLDYFVLAETSVSVFDCLALVSSTLDTLASSSGSDWLELVAAATGVDWLEPATSGLDSMSVFLR